MNPTYRLPLGCIVLGVLVVLSGLVVLIVLHHTGQLGFEKSSHTGYVPALCASGLTCIMIGSCAYCTLRQRVHGNWQECKRLQSAHDILLGRPDDPNSQAQPIISGYDPRRSPWQPN